MVPSCCFCLPLSALQYFPRVERRESIPWSRCGSTIAQFKTPSLRDGEDSQPYFHNRSKASFDDVVRFYIQSSQLARSGQRNAPLEFREMSLSEEDVLSWRSYER